MQELIEVLEGENITFNVLDNDFGQNIRVVSIVEMPECGTLLDGSADGIMDYRIIEGEDCLQEDWFGIVRFKAIV